MAEKNREDSKKPEDEVPRQVYDIQLEETVGDLKREKAAQKTAFTKVRRSVLTIIPREEVDIKELKDMCDELDMALENVMNVMNRLFDRYKIDKDRKNFEKLGDEIEQIEIEYSNAQNCAQKVMDSLGHRRQVTLYFEEVDNFRPICPGNYKEIEKLADLLDITIVNLREANHFEELNVYYT